MTLQLSVTTTHTVMTLQLSVTTTHTHTIYRIYG